MSVPVGKRGHGKLEVLTKAIELAEYTLTVCKNEDVFPKRERWILTSRIVNEALDILTYVRKGNSIRVETQNDFERRREYQQRAFENCENLITLMDLALRHGNLDARRAEHWTGLILEVEGLLSAWRRSDREAWRKRKIDPPQGDQ